jgi:hypothetical protein
LHHEAGNFQKHPIKSDGGIFDIICHPIDISHFEVADFKSGGWHCLSSILSPQNGRKQNGCQKTFISL